MIEFGKFTNRFRKGDIVYVPTNRNPEMNIHWRETPMKVVAVDPHGQPAWPYMCIREGDERNVQGHFTETELDYYNVR